MTVTLHYKWEDCPYQSLNYEASYRSNEPRYYMRRGTVEYDYDVDVKLKDVLEYLLPPSFNDKEEKQMYINGMRKMFEFLDDNEALDFGMIEGDDFFIEFLMEKYEELAYAEYEDSFE